MIKLIKMFFLIVLLILACHLGNTLLNGSMISHDVSVENSADLPDENAVNINSADVDELCQVKYIGKTIAGYIVDYREKFGDFTNIEQIKNIDGINDSIYEKIRPYIKLEGE